MDSVDTSETTSPHDLRGAALGQLSVQERAAWGRTARSVAPLASHGELRRTTSRTPVELLLGQAEGRVPELVPIRHGRMLVSPFTFYRGAALLMAADLAGTPTSGLRTQLCGDAHLSNFGAYASPERRLVFDINDFDETFPGPFEWDVKRLATSFAVASRDNGFTTKESRRVTLIAAESYRTAMRAFAGQPILTVWYAHLDIEYAFAQFSASLAERKRKEHKSDLKGTKKIIAKAHARDSLQALDKLTVLVDGRPRIVSDPPLITRLDDMTGLDTDVVLGRITELVARYRGTLSPDRRRLLDHFELVDVGHKVVGVGSVGTRAWILVFQGRTDGEALTLQAKQAQRSVLADYVTSTSGPVGADIADPSRDMTDGERVVTGQRLMQASSDIFLGWLRSMTPDGVAEDYYLRQLRDWKVSAEIERLSPTSMEIYARLCGWTLARAHARSGDRVAIAAYLGKSTRFDEAISEFAETYADVNERDYAAFSAAVDAGVVEAESGL